MKRYLLLCLSFVLVLGLVITLFPTDSAHAATTDVIYEAENGTNGKSFLAAALIVQKVKATMVYVVNNCGRNDENNE